LPVLSGEVSIPSPTLRPNNPFNPFHSSTNTARCWDIPLLSISCLHLQLSRTDINTLYSLLSVSSEVKNEATKEMKDQQSRRCMYKRNAEARSCNNCCHGKAVSIAYSECLSVALVIQQAQRVASLAVTYFSTLSLKRHHFLEKCF
jgi:hypothetical protein